MATAVQALSAKRMSGTIPGVLTLVSPAFYVEAYSRRPETGGPYTFDRFPFQRGIYSDLHPNIVVMKALQLGCSEYAIQRAFHAGDRLKMNVMYAFPHSSELSKFARARIFSMIDASPRYSRLLHAKSRITHHAHSENIMLMSFGGRYLYLVGVTKTSQVQAHSVDFVIRDERDLMDEVNAEALLYRNSASDRPFFLTLGHPTIANYGIASDWEASDKREYMVRCACGQEQDLQWPRNVDRKRRLRVCWKCGESLEPQLEDWRRGRWAPTAKGNGAHGYHVSKLLFPGLNWEQLLKNADNSIRVREFYNYDLGLPYSEGGTQILPSVFRACLRPDMRLGPAPGKLYLGCDVGSVLHVWVETADKRIVDCKIFGGETKFEDLAAYIRSRRIIAAGVDLMPETNEVAKLTRRFFGLVYGINFADFATRPQDEADMDIEPVPVARVNRTLLLDWNAEDFIKGRVHLPGDAVANFPEIEDHFCCMTRRTETTKTGGVVSRWVTPEGKPDHWAFARAACLAAQRIEGWLVAAGAAPPPPQEEKGTPPGYEQFRRKLRAR